MATRQAWAKWAVVLAAAALLAAPGCSSKPEPSQGNTGQGAKAAEQALRDALARVEGRPLRGHVRAMNCVAISPDGRWVVTGSDDNTARLWDLTVKAPAAAPIVLRGHEAGIPCVAISPDRGRLPGKSRLTGRAARLD